MAGSCPPKPRPRWRAGGDAALEPPAAYAVFPRPAPPPPPAGAAPAPPPPPLDLYALVWESAYGGGRRGAHADLVAAADYVYASAHAAQRGRPAPAPLSALVGQLSRAEVGALAGGPHDLDITDDQLFGAVAEADAGGLGSARAAAVAALAAGLALHGPYGRASGGRLRQVHARGHAAVTWEEVRAHAERDRFERGRAHGCAPTAACARRLADRALEAVLLDALRAWHGLRLAAASLAAVVDAEPPLARVDAARAWAHLALARAAEAARRRPPPSARGAASSLAARALARGVVVARVLARWDKLLLLAVATGAAAAVALAVVFLPTRLVRRWRRGGGWETLWPWLVQNRQVRRAADWYTRVAAGPLAFAFVLARLAAALATLPFTVPLALAADPMNVLYGCVALAVPTAAALAGGLLLRLGTPTAAAAPRSPPLLVALAAAASTALAAWAIGASPWWPFPRASRRATQTAVALAGAAAAVATLLLQERRAGAGDAEEAGRGAAAQEAGPAAPPAGEAVGCEAVAAAAAAEAAAERAAAAPAPRRAAPAPAPAPAKGPHELFVSAQLAAMLAATAVLLVLPSLEPSAAARLRLLRGP